MAKRLIEDIELRLEHIDISAMHFLYHDLKESWRADRDSKHELLLKEHIKSMAVKWRKYYEADKDKCKIKISSAEAMAFMQTWCGKMLLFDDFTNHTIQNIISQIYKQAADLRVKALIRYENEQ